MKTINQLTTAFHNLTNSVPLALKWSILISCFVSAIMGSLGWYLINQQTLSFRQQSELLGQIVADQLAKAASEPLLADDELTLQLLVSQQEKNQLIRGMEIYDVQANLRARAGMTSFANIASIIASPLLTPKADWGSNRFDIASFFSPIEFKKIRVGLAVVTIDQKQFEKNLDSLTRALLTSTLSLILIGIMLASLLAYRLARPFHHLVAVGEALDNALLLPNGMPERRNDTIGRILTTFNRMGDKLAENRHAQEAFSRHLSPSIAREVLNTPRGSSLGGTTIIGSVLFCDIVGFTELAEDMLPSDVGNLLNQYFNYFSLAAHSCDGTVDKFIGDCVMILFGVPDHDRLHGLHSLTCAVLIQEIAARINLTRKNNGQATVEFRLGINSGVMLAGNLGGTERMQYTVVGDTVNVASRICAMAEPGKVLATQEVFDQPKVSQLINCKPMSPVIAKGRKKLVTPYSISLANFVDDHRIRQELEKILPQVTQQ